MRLIRHRIGYPIFRIAADVPPFRHMKLVLDIFVRGDQALIVCSVEGLISAEKSIRDDSDLNHQRYW
jgi:hypothetical protein